MPTGGDADGSTGEGSRGPVTAPWKPVRIHDILLVPSAGRFGPGLYSRGVELPYICEVDVVDIYLKYIVDELDGHGVRHKIAPTRSAEGVAAEERGAKAPGHTLIVHCAVGDAKAIGASSSNMSRVTYSGSGKACAEEMSDCLAEWGSLYVHSHKRANPVVDKALVCPTDCLSMRIEPFALNGHSAGEYLKRLASLGRDIGRLLCEWTKQRGQGALRASTLEF